MKLGLDLVLDSPTNLGTNSRIGLIVNPASVNSRLQHAIELFNHHPKFTLKSLFGPQHGIRGETQDNMIEWKSFRDSRTGLPVHSLYGETRQPTRKMLEDIDVLIFDLQDVGTRVFTFIYTMALAMYAARETGLRFVVLDRPNPINGVQVEGNVLEPDYRSFVGMFPIAMRHGMTAGELALMFNVEFGIGCDLEVVRMEGWRREMWHDETGLEFVMPSPNMPSVETAAVYPGTVLLEGTEISEGRGTARPFEIVGAPYIDPFELAELLSAENLPGVLFRPLRFQPTFNKFAGQLCGGIQIHVMDRREFKPFLAGVAIISSIRRLYPDDFRWKQPPYEYEFDKLPFDVIAGTGRLREEIERGAPLPEIEGSWQKDLVAFIDRRKEFLIY